MSIAMFVSASVLLAQGASSPAPLQTSTVGMPARIEELVLPGSELVAEPIVDRKAPIVLRITAVYPHGTAHRYDLEFYGLEPGRFDLRDYLERKEGSPLGDVPPIPVEVRSVIPAGKIKPHELDPGPIPSLGGYQTLLIAGGVLWALGLGAILFAGRRRRRAAMEAEARPVTLAERLRPYVDDAVAGRLAPAQKAELERMLLVYWRRKLHLEDLPAAEAIAQMRADAEGGELLRQLESWLHRREPPTEVDLAALLEPYRHLPSEEPGNEEATTPA